MSDCCAACAYSVKGDTLQNFDTTPGVQRFWRLLWCARYPKPIPVSARHVCGEYRYGTVPLEDRPVRRLNQWTEAFTDVLPEDA